MKTELTERDKKLLVMLSIFVIVVCIGYWGIYPNVKAIKQYKKDYEKENDKKIENQMKESMIAVFEKDNEELEGEIDEYKSRFFPYMTSDKIDKYLTNVVIGYGLRSYDLEISMRETEKNIEPYYLSAKFLNATQVNEVAIGSEEENSDEASSGGNVDYEAFAEIYNIKKQINKVSVAMKVGGDKDKIQRFINEISVDSDKIRVAGYSWTQNTMIVDTEEGKFDVITEDLLNIYLELYMRAEE